MNENDHKYQSILCRFDSSEPIDIYQSATLLYGIGPSGYLAGRVVKQTAKEHEFKFPMRAEILQKEIYFDNVYFRGHSIDEAETKTA